MGGRGTKHLSDVQNAQLNSSGHNGFHQKKHGSNSRMTVGGSTPPSGSNSHGDDKSLYMTYTKQHEISKEIYTGRTSGYGSPEEIVEQRDRSHHMNDHYLMGPAKVDVFSNSYAAIRGREDLLIQRHGGPQHFGGVSGNYRQGIGDNNKNKAYYINKSKKEFD